MTAGVPEPAAVSGSPNGVETASEPAPHTRHDEVRRPAGLEDFTDADLEARVEFYESVIRAPRNAGQAIRARRKLGALYTERTKRRNLLEPT